MSSAVSSFSDSQSQIVKKTDESMLEKMKSRLTLTSLSENMLIENIIEPYLTVADIICFEVVF